MSAGKSVAVKDNLDKLGVRNRLLLELRRELLGPRGGLYEGMPPNEDPLNEYVTGILEPHNTRSGGLILLGGADLQTNEFGNAGEDDDELGLEEVGPSLQLDPLALPKSLGVSFVLSGSVNHTIDICVTYARYLKEGKRWKRKPEKFILNGAKIKEGENKFDTGGNATLLVRTSLLNDSSSHVSVFLVNDTAIDADAKPRTEDMIFQPQIRIACGDGSVPQALRGQHGKDAEEENLALLYNRKQALARGHFCSAVWKDVDPEKPFPTTDSDTPDSFEWVDSELLEDDEKEKFRWPSLRTEYIPCYAVKQPTTNPPSKISPLLDLPTESLSETFDPLELKRRLEPIVAAYFEWVNQKSDEVESLPAQYKDQGNKNIAACRITAERISAGIELLTKNEPARLAFCFMNQVMYVQSTWKNPKKPLAWRIFQIAFILQSLPSIVDSSHPDRGICDLLWFPTGGGKTEAYLGLAIFTLGYRRRRIPGGDDADSELGTAVISRYTLRLLTIQQYRRALLTITAAELLRVQNWKPAGCAVTGTLWGELRFSLGLWVGGEVTPNRLMDRPGWDAIRNRPTVYEGAVGTLANPDSNQFKGGEPAQILNCPTCNAILAVSNSNLTAGKNILHWIFECDSPTIPKTSSLSDPVIKVESVKVRKLPNPRYNVVSIEFQSNHNLDAKDVTNWWNNRVRKELGENSAVSSASPSRPGYFLRRFGMSQIPIDFEIRCPNPDCKLNLTNWHERVPGKTGEAFWPILPPFVQPKLPGYSVGIPIPAYVIDDQIYHRCPSMIIATVDKFARLPFEPRAAAIFGNVNAYDEGWGYFRESSPPERGGMSPGNIVPVRRFNPPDLIIQDELHLIEGPLGSMVGMYETAIELLSTRSDSGICKPKYVASSATIRHAGQQVKAVFNREVSQFPPPGLDVDDNFFSKTQDAHQLDSDSAGRLYVGICAPGRGAHTPPIRIWALLLQIVWECSLKNGRANPDVDSFWTIVGYFNAMRILAATEANNREDIPLRIDDIAARRGTRPRPRNPLHVELSSRTPSADIPGNLTKLAKIPSEVDAVFATSMFGTGVDIERLGLMVVAGQPKASSHYIQATGRVGRQSGGMVITFLRSTMPRDLDHYEFFMGYHRSMARLVEPITVYPFSPRARERALGPVSVAILRNAEYIGAAKVDSSWAIESKGQKTKPTGTGPTLIAGRRHSNEIVELQNHIQRRSDAQPMELRPGGTTVANDLGSELDKWEIDANNWPSLLYCEYSFGKQPTSAVVLGDPQHTESNLPQVFSNAPQSLRDVESTTTFEG